MLQASGIATEPDEFRTLLKAEMEKQGSMIANDSKYSPFWRLIEAGVVTASTWLIDKALINHVLPNSFLATATGEQLKLKAWECQIEQKPATKTQGMIVFTRTAGSAQAVAIPKGTFVQTNPINGKIYRVLTVNDAVIEVDTQSVSVAVSAESEGAAYNLGGGYYTILPIAIAGVGAVTNEDEWITSAGQDIEADDDLRMRVRNQWSAVARWHIDAAYRSLLMKQSGLQHDNIYFEHDAPRGPGTANCYILMDIGEPSETMIMDLNTLIQTEGNHGHGDDMQVSAMPATEHDLICKIWFKPTVLDEDKAAIILGVEDCIKSAFRENLNYNVTKTAPLGKFSFSKLEGEIHDLFNQIDTIRFDMDFIESNLTIPRLNKLEILTP